MAEEDGDGDVEASGVFWRLAVWRLAVWPSGRGKLGAPEVWCTEAEAGRRMEETEMVAGGGRWAGLAGNGVSKS
jgi:hypothetical protein